MSSKEIKLPKDFLLIRECANSTIKILRKFLKKKNRMFLLNFSNVENCRRGDIMVLVAQLEKATIVKKIKFKTISHPKSLRIRNILKSAKAFHLSIQDDQQKKDYIATKAKILNPIIVSSALKELMKVGIKKDFQDYFGIFMNELIANATEHGIENRNINWWLSHDIDRKSSAINFAFADMGLGIISSYKKSGLPFKYKFLSDRRIILDVVNGILGSSTKQPNRGRGFPQLMDFVKKNHISDFLLITNCVSLQFKKGQFIVSENPNFVGTYFSWSVNKENYNLWRNLQ